MAVHCQGQRRNYKDNEEIVLFTCITWSKRQCTNHIKLVAPLSSRHLQHLRATNEASASLSSPLTTISSHFFTQPRRSQAPERIPRASLPTRAHNRDVSRPLTPLLRSTYCARIFLRPYQASTGDATRITTKRCTKPNSQLFALSYGGLPRPCHLPYLPQP
jgi:hypothetical protein